MNFDNKIKKFQVNVDGKLLNIPIVDVANFNKVLGIDNALNYPVDSLKKPLADFKMEVDDSPIFRYIYRNLQPKRHLEFGTWQGTGVTYCIEESKATIWTINLPFGEKNNLGEKVYGNYGYETSELQNWANIIGFPKQDIYPTDSIGFIGRKYLEKGYGNRVCQIYSNSVKWDISNYPSEFFDTILVDGAHDKDIVVNDTQKGFSLLRKGGIIMWHDFCPEIWNLYDSTKGVMQGICEQWDFLIENTTKLFWIYPSWILVGIKK